MKFAKDLRHTGLLILLICSGQTTLAIDIERSDVK